LVHEWRDGDKVELSLPMQLTSEPLAGDPSTRAALFGPLALAADWGPAPKEASLRIGSDDPWVRKLHLPDAEPNPSVASGDVGDWMEVLSAKDLTFKSRGTNPLVVKPMYRITDEKYSIYWTAQKKT
jgi:hypothetical protein